MKATILLFHRVHPARDILWDPMDPKLFEKLMRFVSEKYEVLPLKELCLNNNRSKKPLLSITFDDGFKDFTEYALPILDKYNLHSTMYVVTDCVENDLPTWTYILDYLFFHTRKLEISFFDYGEDCREFALYQWVSKKEQVLYCKKFKQALKKIDSHRRTKIIDFFKSQFDDVDIPSGLMLSWQELKSIDKSKVDIGSHTISHPPLATINDEEELMTEIKNSGEIIKRQLGISPVSISYPVGSYNDKVKMLSSKAGYKIGLAVDQKIYNTTRHDLFAVPRIDLYNDSFLRNKLKIYGVEAAINSILKR